MTTIPLSPSRPLRALGIVMFGWVVARTAFLWPAGTAHEMRISAAAPAVRAHSGPHEATSLLLTTRMSLPAQEQVAAPDITALTDAIAFTSTRLTSATPGNAPEPSTLPGPATATATPVPVALPPGLQPVAASWKRFSGSAWALMRTDSAPSLASGGQLGGSQAGFRLFYSPGPAAFSLTARISTPLASPTGREAALGVALRSRNIGAIVEQRFALDRGGRSDPAAFVYGGVSEVALAMRFKLDGYAQAGVVGLRSPAMFADGALRIERKIIGNRTSASIGAGVWGGAQPGVSRLDIGPQIVARLPVATTNLRVSAEWRERIAGSAAPTSGPSVTVGFDF